MGEDRKVKGHYCTIGREEVRGSQTGREAQVFG